MTNHESMAAWIKDLRARTGLTQKALGERVGLEQNSLAIIEMGKRCPSRSALILMRQSSDLIGMPPPPTCIPSHRKAAE